MLHLTLSLPSTLLTAPVSSIPVSVPVNSSLLSRVSPMALAAVVPWVPGTSDPPGGGNCPGCLAW